MISQATDSFTRPMPRVAFRLLRANNLEPLTQTVDAELTDLTNKGALLILRQAFIDGIHVIMDVHNTTPKLVQVFFPGEITLPPEQRSLVGRVVSYNLDYGRGGTRFFLELCWEEGRPNINGHPRTLRRLMEKMETAPQPEA